MHTNLKHHTPIFITGFADVTNIQISIHFKFDKMWEFFRYLYAQVPKMLFSNMKYLTKIYF